MLMKKLLLKSAVIAASVLMLFASCSNDEPAQGDTEQNKNTSLCKMTQKEFAEATQGKFFYGTRDDIHKYVNSKGDVFDYTQAALTGGSDPAINGYYFEDDKCWVFFIPGPGPNADPTPVKKCFTYAYNSENNDVTLLDKNNIKSSFSFKFENINDSKFYTRTDYGCLDLAFVPGEAFTSIGPDPNSYIRKSFTLTIGEEAEQIKKWHSLKE